MNDGNATETSREFPGPTKSMLIDKVLLLCLLRYTSLCIVVCVYCYFYVCCIIKVSDARPPALESDIAFRWWGGDPVTHVMSYIA